MNVSSWRNVGLLGLMALGVTGAANAQTLSLQPAAQIAAVSATPLTFTVYLTNSPALNGYDINIFIPTQFLSFATASPSFFTNLDSADFPFSQASTPFTINGNDLTVSFSSSSSATPPTVDPLFSFQVLVNSPLPATGAQITFGTFGVSGALGGSQLSTPDGTTVQGGTVVPATLFPNAVVPETSPVALLGLGLLPLGLLAARRRTARN